MQYVSKSCPHCGHRYSFDSKGAGYYGSPIRICNKCKKRFIDKDYREIAIDGIRDVDTKRISLSTLIPSVFTFLFGIVIAIAFLPDIIAKSSWSIWHFVLALFLFGSPIFLILSEYKDYDSRQKFLEKERKESEARLSDHDYALFLKSLGYTIPSKYLPNSTNE